VITDFGLQGTPGGSGFDSIAELQRFVDEVVPHVRLLPKADVH